MAILPDVNSLSRRSVQDRGGIATKRTGQVGAALQGLAGEIGQIEQQRQVKEDRLSYANAKSSLLQADIKARGELEGDPDWETYGDRYNEKMKAARENASSMLSSNADKAMFSIESQDDIARGNEAVRKYAWKGEVDSGRASLASYLDGNRQGVLTAKDYESKAAFIEASNEQLSGAMEKGYISAVEGESMRQKWTDDVSESSVLMMDAEKRVAILSKPKGTLAENIDPARRNLLLTAAQNENKEIITRGKSQAETDKIISKGGSLGEQLKSAREIEDPNVRAMTETAVKTRYAEAETITNAVKSEALTQGYDIALNGGQWKDIPPSTITAMDPKDALNLRAYMSKEGDVKTDRAEWYSLTKLATDDPTAFVGIDLLKYRNVLSESDFQSMANKQSTMKEKGVADFELRSNNQKVDAQLIEMSVDISAKAGNTDIKKAAAFRYQFEQRVNDFQDEYKRKPTGDEKQVILDDMTRKINITDAGFAWFDKDKRKYEITEEDVLVVPEEEKTKITDMLNRRDIPVSEDVIQKIYRNKVLGNK